MLMHKDEEGRVVNTGERNPLPVNVVSGGGGGSGGSEERTLPYVGFSGSSKPSGKEGESYYEVDTGDVYISDGVEWYKL